MRRLLWVALLPPAFFTIISIPGFFQKSFLPQAHFEHLTKTSFPQSAHEIKAYFSGGLLADREDIFYFRCSNEDTENLIQSLKLRPTSGGTTPYMLNYVRKGAAWPDPNQWKNVKLYEGHEGRTDADDPKNEYPYCFYMLITDESRTQVYLEISNT